MKVNFPAEGFTELELNPAKLSDKGTCTCHAEGQGGEDSADIEVEGEEKETDVTITPKVTELTCQQGDKAKCNVSFDITSTTGVSFCSSIHLTNGQMTVRAVC